MAVTDGYYTVRNAYNGLLLDVNGGSQANGAFSVVGVPSDTNSQIMYVKEEGENVLLYPAHTKGINESGTYLPDADPRLGITTIWWGGSATTNVDGFGVATSNLWDDGTRVDNELWTLTETTDSLDVNGVSYPAYRVETAYVDSTEEDHLLTPPEMSGPQRCIVRVPYTATWDNIKRYQEWAFVPSVPFDTALPVPYLGSTGSPDWRARNTTIGIVMFDDDIGTVRPVWASKASAHQLRWRRRDLSDQDTSIGEWSNWTAWGSDGSSDGWGADPTTPSSGIENDGDMFYPSTGIGVDFTGDTFRTEIEWNIRAIDVSKPAVGGTYGFTSVVVRKFKIVSATCTKTPTGLYISFVTSYPDDMVQSSTAVGTDGSFSRVSSDDGTSIFVKNKQISIMPNVGDEIEVTLTAVSTDGYSASWNGTLTVELGGSYGSAPTVTCSVNGTIATVTATPSSGMSISGAWLVVPRGHGDRYVELDGDSPWTVVPPLGVPWSVFVSAESDDEWGYDATVRDAIIEEPPSYHVTSRNGKKDFAVALRKSAPGPSFTPTYTRSRNETETYSRERPVYGYSDVTKAEWQLVGDLVGGVGVREADWAAHESHVYFRSPNGFWAQCAINSLRIDLSSNQSQEVSINFSEEVW